MAHQTTSSGPASTRWGIALKIGAGMGVLVAVTIFIAVSILIYLFQFRDSVDELAVGSLPRIILFADLERGLEDVLYTTDELSRTTDPRTHRNLTEDIEVQLVRIGEVLATPELRSQSGELGALNDAITTSLASLSQAVLSRIDLQGQLNAHLQTMRALRRTSFDENLPVELRNLINELEEALSLEDRYELRVADQRTQDMYNGLLAITDFAQQPEVGEATEKLTAPADGVLQVYDDYLKTSAAIRGLRSEVASIVSDFAFVAQARFRTFQAVATDNAASLRDTTQTIYQGLVASLIMTLVVAVLVSRFLRQSVSSRLASLQQILLSEARKFSDDPEKDALMREAEGGDEITAISGSMDVFLSEIGQANDRLRASLKQMERDVDLARIMQENIVPSKFPSDPSFDIAASMSAAKHVGGDFYEFFQLDDNHVGIAIADVSGKGVPAAFFMAMTLTILEAASQQYRSPAQVLAQVNARLNQQNPLDHFVTMFYGVLNLRDGRFAYANAGHNPPYLLRKGKPTLLPNPDNMVAGMFEDLVYDEKEVVLSRGDMLFLFTDGIPEAFDAVDEAFGDERLVSCLSNSTHLPPVGVVKAVTRAVKTFVAGAQQSDDITCLAFRFNGVSRGIQARVDEPASLELDIANEVTFIPGIHDRLEPFYVRNAIADDIKFQANLCIEEYIVNLINYGYGDGGEHVIRLKAKVGADGLTVQVQDDGNPFDPETAPEPDLARPVETMPVGGLGVHLIRSYMDDMDYVTDGGENTFTMRKSLQIN